MARRAGRRDNGGHGAPPEERRDRRQRTPPRLWAGTPPATGAARLPCRKPRRSGRRPHVAPSPRGRAGGPSGPAGPGRPVARPRRRAAGMARVLL